MRFSISARTTPKLRGAEYHESGSLGISHACRCLRSMPRRVRASRDANGNQSGLTFRLLDELSLAQRRPRTAKIEDGWTAQAAPAVNRVYTHSRGTPVPTGSARPSIQVFGLNGHTQSSPTSRPLYCFASLDRPCSSNIGFAYP